MTRLGLLGLAGNRLELGGQGGEDSGLGAEYGALTRRPGISTTNNSPALVWMTAWAHVEPTAELST